MAELAVALRAGSEVLVVDDSPSVRLVIQRMLRPLGLTVTEARSGREALARLESGEPPDLVLCDVLLDDLSGVEICRRLRASDRLRRLPVVLISGQATAEMVSRSDLSGLTRMLRKPFRAETLIAEVNDLLAAGALATDGAGAPDPRPSSAADLGDAHPFLERLQRLPGLRGWAWRLGDGPRGPFDAGGGAAPSPAELDALLAALSRAAAPLGMGIPELTTLQDRAGGVVLAGCRRGAGALFLRLSAGAGLGRASHLSRMFLRCLATNSTSLLDRKEPAQ